MAITIRHLFYVLLFLALMALSFSVYKTTSIPTPYEHAQAWITANYPGESFSGRCSTRDPDHDGYVQCAMNVDNHDDLIYIVCPQMTTDDCIRIAHPAAF